MKFLSSTLALLLCSLLVVAPITGCSVSQQKVNTVVQDIATWAPIISTDATTLASAVESFDPADAALIQKAVSDLQQDSGLLTTLCNQYLANPSQNILNQITSLVSNIATVDSDALLATLQIKNADSLATAKTILAGIATAVTILDGYLATINVSVTPAARQSLKSIKPYVQTTVMVKELNKAKSQNLVPQNITLQYLGY